MICFIDIVIEKLYRFFILFESNIRKHIQNQSDRLIRQ